MKRNYLKLFVSTLLLGLTHGIGYAAPLSSGSSESVVVKFAAKNGAAARGATSTMPDKLLPISLMVILTVTFLHR